MSTIALRFQPSVRQNNGLLAAAEAKALHWLAARMPGCIHPDHLTCLGLFAMLGAGLSYWLASVNRVGFVAASFCLALNWLGDSLDGTLARYRNRQRPRYGFYVDHVVDAVSAVFLFAGLALSGWMSPAVAAALLVAYLTLSIETYLAAYCLGEFQLAHAGCGPTELRFLLVAANIALLVRGPQVTVLGEPRLLLDVGGCIGAFGMVAVLVRVAATNIKRLHQLERVP